MVQAFAPTQPVAFDYSEYGDYLLLSDEDVRRRLHFTSKAMRSVFADIKRRFNNAVVLDFGSGAGYCARAAEAYGFTTYGVEPSDKLVNFSRDKVGFHNIYKSIDEMDVQCDAIFMSDVIEHLPPESHRSVMRRLLEHLGPYGILVGNTPNFNSLNILLCEERDPVVAPPSHVCYFSPSTLDRYFVSLGLTKLKCYTRGLSSNAFFRRSKFERSFLEVSLRKASLWRLPVLLGLRMSFALAGLALQPTGLGYQMYFLYQKRA